MARLDSSLQQEEAIYDMQEYSRVGNRLVELRARMDGTGKRLSYQEMEQTKNLYESYLERQSQLDGMIRQKYDVEKPRELDMELQKIGINFREYRYGQSGQEGQDPFSRVTSIDAAQQDCLEKAHTAIKAAQAYEEEARKLEELRVRGKNYYLAQEAEAQKALKAMQQANAELSQSYARLMEVMQGHQPQQQGNILNPEIQKAFGKEQDPQDFDAIYEQHMKTYNEKQKDRNRDDHDKEM